MNWNTTNNAEEKARLSLHTLGLETDLNTVTKLNLENEVEAVIKTVEWSLNRGLTERECLKIAHNVNNVYEMLLTRDLDAYLSDMVNYTIKELKGA